MVNGKWSAMDDEFNGRAEAMEARREKIAEEGFLREQGLAGSPDDGYSLGRSL